MEHSNDIIFFGRGAGKYSLGVEAYLVSQFKEAPLKVFDDSFARFVCSLLGSGKRIYFNMHVADIAVLQPLTQACLTASAAASAAPVADGNPAFTTRFRFGELKGKSPAEVLIESGRKAGGTILNEQYQLLKKSVDKYPANKELMDAISAAAKLSDEQLSSARPTGGSSQVIFETGIRPLVRNKREDGLCFCYSGKISIDMSRKFPVTIEAENCYCPVEVKDGGQLNVAASKKADAVKGSINLTLAEWFSMCAAMQRAADAFYICNFNKALAAADAGRKAAIAEATKSAEPTA